MSNYIGVKCPVCNKKFVQTDDIVVCPICGAPHHRECYARNSACVFTADHLSGKEWIPPTYEPSAGNPGGTPSSVTICPACKSSNPKDVIFCQVCGKRMSEVPVRDNSDAGKNSWSFPGFIMEGLDPVSLMYGGLSPDEKIEDESVRDLAVYVGDNSAYYLPHFKRMHKTSRTLSFNFSALIFSFFYFFYRKMYLIGAILLALFLIGSIPSILQSYVELPRVINHYWGSDLAVDATKLEYYKSIVNLASTINLLICSVMSFCANRFYYLKVMADVKKIREAKTEPHDEIAYNSQLSQKGGVNKTAVIIVLCSVVALNLIMGFFIAYQYMNVGGLWT